jgi:hypothetical protein
VIAVVAAGAISWVPAMCKPHMVPPDTRVALTLPKESSFDIVATFDDLPDTINCDGLKATVVTPSDGLTAGLVKPPKLGTSAGCADTIAGFDKVSTSGSWYFSLGPTGTAGSVTMAAGGAVIRFNFEPSCVITMSPQAPTKLRGSYNGTDTFTLNKAKVPISGSGCSVSKTAEVSATIVLTPGVSVQRHEPGEHLGRHGVEGSERVFDSGGQPAGAGGRPHRSAMKRLPLRQR